VISGAAQSVEQPPDRPAGALQPRNAISRLRDPSAAHTITSVPFHRAAHLPGSIRHRRHRRRRPKERAGHHRRRRWTSRLLMPAQHYWLAVVTGQDVPPSPPLPGRTTIASTPRNKTRGVREAGSSLSIVQSGTHGPSATRCPMFAAFVVLPVVATLLPVAPGRALGMSAASNVTL
jgi:hypothetical protein